MQSQSDFDVFIFLKNTNPRLPQSHHFIFQFGSNAGPSIRDCLFSPLHKMSNPSFIPPPCWRLLTAAHERTHSRKFVPTTITENPQVDSPAASHLSSCYPSKQFLTRVNLSFLVIWVNLLSLIPTAPLFGVYLPYMHL